MAGGNKQRGYILKEDASSPTVSNAAVMLTCVIDADENRDFAIVDIPNAFVQTVVMVCLKLELWPGATSSVDTY